jgi:hypothetical protein
MPATYPTSFILLSFITKILFVEFHLYPFAKERFIVENIAAFYRIIWIPIRHSVWIRKIFIHGQHLKKWVNISYTYISEKRDKVFSIIQSVCMCLTRRDIARVFYLSDRSFKHFIAGPLWFWQFPSTTHLFCVMLIEWNRIMYLNFRAILIPIRFLKFERKKGHSFRSSETF